MPSPEGIALRLASTVVSRLAASWLSDQRFKQRQGRPLAALVTGAFPSVLEQRAVQREFKKIEAAVAKHLIPLTGNEYRSLTIHDRQVVLSGAIELLDSAEIPDELLFSVNLDHRSLAKELIRRNAGFVRSSGFSSDELAFLKMALDHACWCLVNLIRNLPEFAPSTATEMLRRSAVLLNRLESTERLAVTEATEARVADNEFLQRYSTLVAATHGFVEVSTVDVASVERIPLDVSYLSLGVRYEDFAAPGIDAELDPSNARWYVSEARRLPWMSHEALRIEAALSRSSRTMIRGEAGSGKTTLMKWLAAACANRSLPPQLSSWNSLTPFLIELRGFLSKRLPHPGQFIEHCAHWVAELEPQGWSYRQLENGNCLLLIDGVDELPRHSVQQFEGGFMT